MTICTYCGKFGGHWLKSDRCPSPQHPDNIARTRIEAREASRREQAGRIADRIIETEQRGTVTEYWNDTTEGVRGLLAAAAFMALTETETAR